ncbi:hypothetical protein AcV7_004170 [Taiwanofungus camphoratus]|nr:hypothetical protein AcV7_004170 [Antrodia cinnamomea]
MLSAQCRNTKLLRSTMLSSVLRPSSVLAQIGPQHHICCLRILSVLTWFLSCLFVQSASVLPLFDSSPRVTIPVSSNSSRLHSSVHPLLRWDSFHFTHIAQHGYVYEHEWAFLSGAPAVMRITALMLRLIGIRSWRSEGTLGAEDVLLGGALATCLCNTTTIFYRLTLHHLRSPSLAFLASLLSLLPSSPATLRLAGYSEPFFTYLSYKGKSFVDLRGSHRVQRRKRHALLCSIPMITLRSVMYAVVLTSIMLLPFVAHQYAAYRSFCQLTATSAPWCTSFPPSIYSHVQAKYWDVGFLRYWSWQQLPNFIISAPVLLLLLTYAASYIRDAFIPRLCAFLPSKGIKPENSSGSRRSSARLQSTSPFLAPSLAPYVIHALFVTLLLLFAAHTQIILRLAASMPVTYWAAAHLLVEKPAWGSRWVAWSVVWGAVSLVLWTTFLPPA